MSFEKPFDRVREREAEVERKELDQRLTAAAKDVVARENPALDAVKALAETLKTDREQGQRDFLQAQIEALKSQHQAQATATADALATAMRPSNTTHPGISVYSHPEGQVKRPKAKLSRETYWCGHRISEDELNPLEIELLNQVRAGKYHGGKWLVKENTDDTGTTRRLEVWFPTKDIDHRMEVPMTSDPVMTGMALMLREMITGQESAKSLVELEARIQELEAQLAVKTEMAALSR